MHAAVAGRRVVEKGDLEIACRLGVDHGVMHAESWFGDPHDDGTLGLEGVDQLGIDPHLAAEAVFLRGATQGEPAKVDLHEKSVSK